MDWWRVRWQTRIFSSRMINPATTCFIYFCRSALPRRAALEIFTVVYAPVAAGLGAWSASALHYCTQRKRGSHLLLHRRRRLCYEMLNLSQTCGCWKALRMNGRSQCLQPVQQRAGWRVQKLVIDAIHSTLPCCFGLLPATADNNLFQRHAIPRAAPCRHDNVWIRVGDFFFRELFPRFAEEPSARGFHQFGHPALRQNQRLAPLLTIDQRLRYRSHLLAHRLNLLLHFLNQLSRANYRFSRLLRRHDSSNVQDVGIHIV